MPYKYQPLKFYTLVFGWTWLLWIGAVFVNKTSMELGMTLMVLGLFVPAAVAVLMVLRSKNKALKKDLKEKILGFYRLKPLYIIGAVALFFLIVVISILFSTLFGGSVTQLSWSQGFSFSINGSSALLTIVLASVVEELGWRGYGEDAIANGCTWFRESVIFGLIWALWHLPLFFMEGTYHYGLTELGPMYALNFFVSCMPLGFLTTWVYVKNNRSMLASIIFHFFVNFFQEQIAMTPETKCLETFVIFAAAAVVVLKNKELFFGRAHIGNLLNE